MAGIGAVLTVALLAHGAVGAVQAVSDVKDHPVDGGSAMMRVPREQEQQEPKVPAGALNELFHWAIEHSDPERLRALAAERSEQPALDDGSTQSAQISRCNSPSELATQRRRVASTMAQFSDAPSERELMLSAISTLQNQNATTDTLHNALTLTLELVEQVDNANDFSSLGGVTALANTLRFSNQPSVLDEALLALGTACANNKEIQEGAAENGIVPDVLSIVLEVRLPEHARRRAIYALSSAVRNSHKAQSALEEEGGASHLGALAQNRTETVPLRKKAIVLTSDLVSSGMPVERAWGEAHTQAACDLLAEDSLDVQEKALAALQVVLERETYAAENMTRRGVGECVQNLREQLDAKESEFAADVKAQTSAVLSALDKHKNR